MTVSVILVGERSDTVVRQLLGQIVDHVHHKTEVHHVARHHGVVSGVVRVPALGDVALGRQ